MSLYQMVYIRLTYKERKKEYKKNIISLKIQNIIKRFKKCKIKIKHYLLFHDIHLLN